MVWDVQSRLVLTAGRRAFHSETGPCRAVGIVVANTMFAISSPSQTLRRRCLLESQTSRCTWRLVRPTPIVESMAWCRGSCRFLPWGSFYAPRGRECVRADSFRVEGTESSEEESSGGLNRVVLYGLDSNLRCQIGRRGLQLSES